MINYLVAFKCKTRVRTNFLAILYLVYVSVEVALELDLIESFMRLIGYNNAWSPKAATSIF